MKEEKCIVLDFLPTGYPGSRYSYPIAQVIGENFFTLLEVVIKENAELKPEDEINIRDPNGPVKYIKGVLKYEDLTNIAKSYIEEIIKKIVKKNEKKFVEIFNKARAITPRMHQLELLPGIGKKHIADLLQEREKKPFESFEDIKNRLKFFPDPIKAITKRILEELQTEQKYYLFVYRKSKRRF